MFLYDNPVTTSKIRPSNKQEHFPLNLLPSLEYIVGTLMVTLGILPHLLPEL